MNNIIEIAPIKTEHIESLTIDCQKLLQNSETLAIATQTDLDNANTILKIVKTKIKELDEDRKNLTQPLEKVKKSIIAKYKPALEMLAKAEGYIKRGIIAFSEKIEVERRKQEEKLRKQMEAKAMKAEDKGKVEKAEEIRQQAELTTVAPTVEKPSNISFTERWYAVVSDDKAVPREYLSIDQAKLDAVARATKGSISIPGVIFKSEKVVRARS